MYKHIEFLEQLTKRAKVSDTPWDIFQEKELGQDWRDLTEFPALLNDSEYRRKPAGINVNNIEFEEPVDFDLPDGTLYYTPDIYKDSGYQEWKKGLFNTLDSFNFEKKLIHLTSESAFNHTKAMLSITVKKPKNENTPNAEPAP